MPQGHQRWSRLVIILGLAIILMMSAARSAWAEQLSSKVQSRQEP
jgi:hypothetical protein